ncbi:hypothetical protein NKH72_13525 [Mesorhizobium sp. M0955]|uniref:hypothetical protein n=1 Tax=Mesorhizobium sp. M0955 TaxID=2957033 RepID=UPI003339D79C
MSETLDDRRRDVEARIETMRTAQGAALLDAKDFDNTDLDRLANELHAISAAEGEEMRRQREKAAVAELERLSNLRKTLMVVEGNRLEAVDRAEKAARDLCDALKEVRARSADATRLLRALGVRPAVLLDVYELEFRMSLRFAAAIKPLVGLGRRFGQITFPEARSPYDKPWRAEEQAIANPDISRALKGSF